MVKYYKFDRILGAYKCLRCEFKTINAMGMQNHIRKHKRRMLSGSIQTKLTGGKKHEMAKQIII